MTVTAQAARTTSTAAAAATVFPYGFKILASADIRVTVAGVVKTLATHYTLTGVGTNAGGNVTFITPMVGGETVTLERNMVYSRANDYQTLGDLFAATLNSDCDAPVLMAQQLAAQIALSLRLPDGSVAPSTLPTPQPLYSLRWNGAGTGIEYYLPSAYAAPTGADLVGFLQSGASAVARTVQAKGRDVVSVKDFGAVGDNVNDDTVAIQLALNSGARCVLLPAGVYKTTAALVIPSNVSIVGAGIYASFIVPATNGQTVFSRINGALTVASISIQDLGIECATTTGVTGVAFTLASNTNMLNVSFGGCSRNFDIDRGNLHNITGCVSRGNASLKAGSFRVWSSSDSDYVYDVQITNYQIRNTGNGVTGSPAVCYFRRAIGSVLAGLHCNDANAGGAVTLVLFENDCQGCRLSGGIVGSSNIAVQFSIGAGVVVAPSFCTVENFEFDQSVTQGVQANAGNWIRIANCNFTASAVGTGIAAVYLNSAIRVTVSGCIFNGYNTVNGTAISVAATSTDVLINDNLVEDCVKGVWPTATTPSGLRVLNNIFKNVTTPLNNFPLTGGTGNRIQGNSGAAVGATTPGVPASTVAVTNVTGHQMRVNIAGGTVTVISIGGQATGLITPCSLMLNPDETIAITYTVAPTWVWQSLA